MSRGGTGNWSSGSTGSCSSSSNIPTTAPTEERLVVNFYIE